MIKERLKQLLGIVYDRIFKIKMAFNKDLKGRYGLLRYVASYSLDDFKMIKKYNDDINKKNIVKVDKIRLGFVVYTSSMWNVGELCELLNKNERFEVSIIVAHARMADEDSSNKEYVKALSFFRNLGVNIIEAKKIKTVSSYNVLFYVSPIVFLENVISEYNIPLRTIILHTSYSYMLAGNMEKLNIWMYHWALKYYTDSNMYKKLIEQSKYYTGNAEYLGFPKMDGFYSASTYRPSMKKIIIYAPHHSVHYSQFKSATFEDNYLAILEIAKKYAEDTYWIYKPHPLLRANSVLGGVFKSVEDYDAYEQQWATLANAEVVTSGDYYSVFKGSSAMITDSVSFLAEYQFTGKPLLLLESGKEKYNQFGEEIVNILYKCDGKAISDIDEFVRNVIEGKDEMQETRMKFFKDNLFYLREGVTANRRIYEDIMRIIDGIQCEESNCK